MKLLWLLLAPITLLAGFAHAQQLPIRSGDHPTFSRLTIPLPASQAWEAQQTTQGIEIAFAGFSRGFDTADVFRRMRPDRIASIDAKADKLTLRVECDCVATAFRNGSLLVIDVADAGTPLAGPPIQKSPAQENRPVQVTKRRSVAAALPWIGGNSPFGAEPLRREAPQSNAEPVEKDAALDERAELLRQIQKNLIEEIANATSTGLLENSYQEATGLMPQQTSPEEVPKLEPRELPELLKTPSRNIRITSSMDRPEGATNLMLHTTTSGIACPRDGILPIETWGDDRGFSAQIGPARNALMDARDRLDKQSAIKLAKLYIYFGFGAEALSALRLDPSLMTEQPELTAVATFLERGALPSPNVLKNYTDCASNIALWATLSFKEIPPNTLIDTNAVLRALNKLPSHLRQIVAPALSDRLLQSGDSETAAAAMRSVERLSDPVTPDAMMSQAALAMNAGETAEEFLEEVIESNSEQSPDALVKLVEAKLANDEPLSYETATLVEAYVQELRGTEMGNKLRQTQIIALSQSQHFDKSFEALDVLSPSLSPETRNNLRNTVLEQLTKKADVPVFLEHVFDRGISSADELPSNTRMAIASRLLDLGFAAQVQQILATFPDTPRVEGRQILAARAALSLRQPFQAQAALIGLEGQEAELLLAQAKEMTGAYREASEIFSSNDATEQAAQAAWLSEEWNDLTPSDAPGFGAIATLVRDTPNEETVDLGPLGRANRALEESTMARDTLEQLLGNPIVQIAPDS